MTDAADRSCALIVYDTVSYTIAWKRSSPMSQPFLVALTETLDAATALSLFLATFAPADPALLQDVSAPSLTCSFAD
jgi:hypothetical protein